MGSCAKTTSPNLKPVADFTCSESQGYAPFTVTFNASLSYDLDGTIETYIWDFGDDSSRQSESRLEGHTYTSAGSYIVELIVVDDDGQESEPSRKLLIVLEYM